MERYCVKVEYRRGDMRELVPVIYSGDRYFDDQGFMYIVVLNPSIVDKWGMTGIKEKVDVEPEEAPPALDKPNLKLRRINDMTRVNTDNIFLGLYKYDGGEHATYYRCEEPLLKELTDEKKLYVFTYGDDVKTEFIMTDKYGRSYVNVGPKELAEYTYFGGPLPNYYFTPPRLEPVVRHTESMGYPVFPDTKPVFSKTRPVESLGRTTHLECGTYSRDAHAREPMSHRERDMDTRSSMRAPVESHSKGMDRQGDMSERTRMRADARRMRPSQVAKCMPKKYGGSGDPYAHVSLFKQVLRAEQITDFHTQYVGFGLTLEGTALTWFQPLDPELFPNIDNVLREFAEEFSKRGIKHNTVSQIYAFKQRENEKVKEASLRFKQYIERCPRRELSQDEKLFVLFMEGLKNETLKKDLHLKACSTFEQVADALSRWAKVNVVSMATHNDLSSMIDEYAIDPDFKDVISAIALGKKEEPFTLEDGYLLHGNRLCITHSLREKVMYESHATPFVVMSEKVMYDSYITFSLREKVMYESHATPFVGHRGIQTTLKAIDTYFFWLTMKRDILDYVSKCVVCQKTKFDRGKQPGLLQPLPIPNSPWESISRDFIFGLSKSIHGNTGIWTIVNRFSKQAHFIRVKKTIKAHQMATLFISQIFKYHGLPTSSVLDRDPRMTNNFWKGLFENLGTRLNFSLAYQPQTDGQSEIANLTILDLLKSYVMEVDQSSQWEKYLPLVEYAYNNTVHTFTAKAPFEVIEGRPKSPLLLKVHGKIFAIDEYSRDLKEFFQKIKRLYPSLNKSKRLLLISTEEP
ncbi:hypothetical protein L7F22_042428 [Adiantum nelumboides]|nr:hypothetical protein [Adiantum nelumboides]